MDFKKGDIIHIVFFGHTEYQRVKLLSDPVYDYYNCNGFTSPDKRWLAEAIHLKGNYKGVIVKQYHVGGCVLCLPLGGKKSIKKFTL